MLLIVILALLLQTSPPAVSMTVDATTQTIHVLNSDPRITDIDLHIGAAVVRVHAPLSERQAIPFSVPCGYADLTIYSVVANGELAGERFNFFQTTIITPCHTYLPLI